MIYVENMVKYVKSYHYGLSDRKIQFQEKKQDCTEVKIMWEESAI